MSLYRQPYSSHVEMLKSSQVLPLRTVALRSSALIGSQTIQDNLLFLLFIWLARTDQSGYGLIVLGMSVVMLLRALQSLGLDQYTLRELSSNRNHPGPFLKRMALIKFFLAVLAILVFVAFAGAKRWPSHQIVVISILLAGQCFEGIADTFFNLFRAEGLSINESLRRTWPSIIASLYGACCLYFKLDMIFFSLLFLLSGSLKFATAAYGAKKLRDFPQIFTQETTIGKSGILSLSLISGTSFLGMFYNEIQTFWLKQYHTLVDIALYRTTHDITASVCGMFSQIIFGAVLFPQLIKVFSNNGGAEFQETVRSYFRKLIAFGSGVSLLLSPFGGAFVALVYGEQYRAAAPLAPIFGVAAFFSFINNFIIYVLLAMREEKLLFRFHFLPVSLSILLGPLLVANFGPIGAATSLLLCRIAFSILLIATLEARLRFFRFADFRNFLWHWLATGITFAAFAALNVSLAGAMALITYFALFAYDQRLSGRTAVSGRKC